MNLVNAILGWKTEKPTTGKLTVQLAPHAQFLINQSTTESTPRQTEVNTHTHFPHDYIEPQQGSKRTAYDRAAISE